MHLYRIPNGSIQNHLYTSRTSTSDANNDNFNITLSQGKRVWCLYVDVMVLDNGGNLFDTIVLAAYTALNNTRYVVSNTLLFQLHIFYNTSLLQHISPLHFSPSTLLSFNTSLLQHFSSSTLLFFNTSLLQYFSP